MSDPATVADYRDFPPSREVPAELALDWARETDPQHLAWARVIQTLEAFALVEDENGALARRALDILSGPPIPGAVWDVIYAHSMVVAGALYGRVPSDRSRRTKLLDMLMDEAGIVRSEIGWAA